VEGEREARERDEGTEEEEEGGGGTVGIEGRGDTERERD
jgi:hypothetical protein